MKKIIAVILLSMFVLVNLASASVTVDINVESRFYENETLDFEYVLSSAKNTTVNYIPLIDCPGMASSLLNIEKANISAGQPEKRIFQGQHVGKDTEPQLCRARINILSPVKKEYSKNFSIITDPALEFRLALNGKVFAKGERIKIDYYSPFKKPNIKATLSSDNKIWKIGLPYEFKAENTGDYKVEAEAWKQGYKNASVTEHFAVIKKHVDFSQKSINKSSNATSGDKKKKASVHSGWVWYVLGGFALVVFLILVIIKKRR